MIETREVSWIAIDIILWRKKDEKRNRNFNVGSPYGCVPCGLRKQGRWSR